MSQSTKWRSALGAPRAAYVHVPFCHHRCPYCNFTLVANRPDWVDRYLSATEKELSRLEEARSVQTIFIGGGTPTLLRETSLSRLLSMLRRWFQLDADGEWTMEANPNDLTPSKCRLLADYGINRISIGGQSFDAEKLNVLGRQHDGDTLRRAIAMAQQHFANVSLDLIFGVPGETRTVLEKDLESAIATQVQHVSTYGLTFEKGAAFWSQLKRGELRAVGEDEELEMYLLAIRRLGDAGMIHYEVSNFARPGFFCRHNETYWRLLPWWGIGPGAASFVDGIRRTNHRSTGKYLQRMEAGESPVAEEEVLDWGQWTRERFVFGMRRMSGVDWEALQREGEPESLDAIRKGVERHTLKGWFHWEGSQVKLSAQGLAISDALWPEYF